MSNNATHAMAAIAASGTSRTDRTIQTNAAIEAKAAFDATVASVTNRFNPDNKVITVQVGTFTITGTKTDVRRILGERLITGEYGAIVTTPDNTELFVTITRNDDASVEMRINRFFPGRTA